MNSKTVWLYLISVEIVLSAIVAAAVTFQWYGLGDPPECRANRQTNLIVPSVPFATPRTGSINASLSTSTDSTRSGYATWYSRASAHREGTGGKNHLMANGRPLNDRMMTCAAWNTKLGQRLRVTNLGTGHTVTVTVTDRGPGRSARRAGKVIDLTPRAFVALGGKLNDGKLTVKVEETK